MQRTNVRLHHTPFGTGAIPDLWVHRSDFGLAAGFGDYECEERASPRGGLVCVLDGTMTAHVEGRRWLVGPGMAVWVPHGRRNQVVANEVTRAVYVQPELRVDPRGARMTQQAPLGPGLRDDVGLLADANSDDESAVAAWRRLTAALRPAEDRGIGLRLPDDDRARRVAAAILADPSDRRTLTEWGESAYASAKTLQRVFARETGVTFPRWRAGARLYASLPRLARHEPVGDVAFAVGFASPPAFIDAFRAHFGVSPRRYFPR